MIHSMTAFARAEAHHAGTTLVWEIRSVNQRYLDLHPRLPEALKSIENDVRELCRQQLNRGKVELTLRLHQPQQEQHMAVNQPLLEQLNQALAVLQNQVQNPAPINLTELLQYPGLLEQEEADYSQLTAPALTALKQALQELRQARAREGEALAGFIQQRLTAMDEQLAIVQQALPQILAAQQQRLRDRIAEVVENIDQDRLEQELVTLANRMDVAEEIDRLKAHQQEAQRILNEGGAVGRRLDFLMQEFNREANTLASKSIDTRTTNAAVELKVLIEQMREQVQNIE